MTRHVHRWAPCYDGFACHCGKSRKSTPVNWQDVAARKRAGREARAAREKKQMPQLVQVTVGQNLHRPVAELLKTLGTLHPGTYTGGSTTWTFSLNTTLTPKQVQAKVWERFLAIWCHVE